LITPEISRWIARWPAPFTLEMARVRIAASRALAYRGDELPFGVVEKASGALVSWAVVHRGQIDRKRGSFGYWIGEEY
jgi:ribosomal-protein-alanine N-acetyltransferase